MMFKNAQNSASSPAMKSNAAPFSTRKLPSWFAWTFLPAALIGTSFVALGSGTAPNFKPVALANTPLFASTTIDKPALALALSVEFPTMGSQYVNVATYSNTTEFLGYYNSEACYSYNNNPTETPVGSEVKADYKRFVRKAADELPNRRCTDSFSGNYLNWASSSAIDMLRLALSGGDRYIDKENLTILQRAILPNGAPAPSCFWNAGNFPAKDLTAGTDNSYSGAVPLAMRTAANGTKITAANTLNQIFFKIGNSAGGCNNTAAYTLGSPPAAALQKTLLQSESSLPTSTSTFTNCSTSTSCTFTGIKEVWYGNSTAGWKYAPASGGISATTCSSKNSCDTAFDFTSSSNTREMKFRDYSGSWAPAGTLNSDGFFYARVEVCGVDSSGNLTDVRTDGTSSANPKPELYQLCKQYPNGKYKPTGVIQKYSDQIRLAAFGYVMEQTASYNAGRYGGVLRAPMKYVGTKTFDETGVDSTPAGGNPNAEWNATTGIYYSNPDNDTTQTKRISGVINYLNQFGRTGPTPGKYKQFDPVGELHYEVLRYLQGLPPSADAIKDLSDPTGALFDGFPIYKTWEDPYANRSAASDYSCVKSNIVVIGDKNTHDGGRLPAASVENNILDIANWRTKVQNFEKQETNQTYVDGAGVTRNTNGNPTRNNAVPTGSSTSQIMGSAYWARTHDIRGSNWSGSNNPSTTANPDKRRPGLRVKTLIFDVNEVGGSTAYGTRSTSNHLFMAAKYGGFETDPSNLGGNPYNTWGNPFVQQIGEAPANSPTTPVNPLIWKKSTGEGDPQSYYLQSDARGVLNAFENIFSRAASASRSIAGGAGSSGSVSSTTKLFTARFDTSNWSGDVTAEPITTVSATDKTLQIGTASWSAANRLDTRTSAATTRNIVAGVEAVTAIPAGQNFTWADIDATLKAHLNKADASATVDTMGAARLAYIRGDKTQEGNPFRVRSTLLGDIVNSNVVYAGPPPLGITGVSYNLFRTANANRTQAVFAGANDGMLHAFDATNGDELFGYIPSWLGPKLSALTDPTFITTHQNYVDAPIAVGEAQTAFSATPVATDWKTVLVSGTGGGGAGVFALDVTNPSAFDSSKVMWEFKRSDDADMGYVVGQPRILKFRTGGTATAPVYRWFAAVASGVNNYVTDAAGRFSTTGAPTIFLLALDKTAGATWTEGSNYFKISLPVDSTLAATVAPGVVNFNALYGRAGEVTDIFAGDLHGKVWKFTFNPGGTWLPTSDWTANKLSYFTKSSVAYPMYIAKTAASAVQPITAAPTLFSGPVVGGIESFYVSFGTGKFLESSDISSPVANSVYTIYDNGSAVADNTAAGRESVISGRGRLAPGTVNTTTKTITVNAFTWGRPASDGATTSRSGWYFDMPATREKLISNIVDLGSLNGAFNTVIPAPAGTAGSCTNATGSGNQYAMDIKTGASTYIESTVGIPGPAIFFVNDTETTETKADSTGRRIRTIKKRGLTIGQSGISATAQAKDVQETVGRLSWRQVHDYQDMKNK